MNRLSVLTIAGFLMMNSRWAMGSEAQRIHFKTGATSAEVQSRLKGWDQPSVTSFMRVKANT